MKHLVLIAFAVSLLGCATSFVPPGEAVRVPNDRVFLKTEPSANSAKATFIRDSGLFGSGSYQHLYINGTKAASLDPGEKVEFSLLPGEYVFGVIPTDPFGTRSINGIDQNLHPGRAYFYRLQTDGATYGMTIQRFMPKE